MNCKHRTNYECDWRKMKPCMACERELAADPRTKEYRSAGYQDASTGRYFPEHYARGTARDAYRMGMDDWKRSQA